MVDVRRDSKHQAVKCILVKPMSLQKVVSSSPIEIESLERQESSYRIIAISLPIAVYMAQR